MQVGDYRLIEGKSANDLALKVQGAIGDGWQPWQAPYASYSDSLKLWFYGQAMVKYSGPK